MSCFIGNASGFLHTQHIHHTRYHQTNNKLQLTTTTSSQETLTQSVPSYPHPHPHAYAHAYDTMHIIEPNHTYLYLTQTQTQPQQHTGNINMAYPYHRSHQLLKQLLQHPTIQQESTAAQTQTQAHAAEADHYQHPAAYGNRTVIQPQHSS